MRYIIHLLYLSNILLLPVGCNLLTKDSPTEEVDSHEKYIINISEYQKDKIIFNDLIHNMQIIQLEKKENCYLHSVDRIYKYKDYIFILDRTSDRVLTFDHSGNYLWDIGRRGMGPGELPDINDMTVDTLNKFIILLTVGKQEIQFFRFNGDYVHSTKNDFQSFYLSVLNEKKKYLIYFINYFDDDYHNIKITNYHNKLISKLFPYPKDVFPMHFKFTGNLVKNYEGVLYSEATSSIINQILPNGNYYRKYVFDFGDRQWPEDQRYEFQQFFKSISQFKIVFLENGYAENQNALIFSYMDKNKERKGIFIKSSHQFYDYRSFFDDDIIFKIISEPKGMSSDNHFISLINFEYVSNLKDKLLIYKNKYNTNKTLISKIMEINEMSNDILVLYDIKN